jgi:hypothetical protein
MNGKQTRNLLHGHAAVGVRVNAKPYRARCALAQNEALHEKTRLLILEFFGLLSSAYQG